MKGKFITTQLRITVKSKLKEKDIHAELADTIAERKRILRQLYAKEWEAKIVAWLHRPQAA